MTFSPDSSTSFGANIYPENVTVGLEQPAIREWVMGKFVLQVKEDADKNRFLFVVVELALFVEGSDEKREAIATFRVQCKSLQAHKFKCDRLAEIPVLKM